jgi:pyruvate dehydrogenase E1 component alpha subunit
MNGVAPALDHLSLHRHMLRVRLLEEQAVTMARQGLLTGFAPATGQEAAQVGSAAALDPAVDFAFPTYRDFAAVATLGVDPVAVLAHHRGLADGGAFDAAAAHVAPLCSVVGGTALHAVGWAMGARLDGAAACALAYFGDGASSQGEVHEALNFAAVFDLPVVFFCQNNGWAISVPAERQVGGGSVAARAAGYGMPGVRVDGNDVLAVHAAVVAAVERARGGGGPTLIEAVTYRLGPHATSDDPSRYRDAAQEAAWRERDPLLRSRARLIEEGMASVEELDAMEVALRVECEQVRSAVGGLVAPSLGEQLELVYARCPPAQRARTEQWLAETAARA